MVERGPEKAGVGGSIPSLATTTITHTHHYASQSRGLCSARRHSCGSLLLWFTPQLAMSENWIELPTPPFQGCLAMQLSRLESEEMIDALVLMGK